MKVTLLELIQAPPIQVATDLRFLENFESEVLKSSKPIVVNVGSANGKIGTSTGRDQGVDQLVPIDKVGHEYIFVRGNGTNDIENVIASADIDGTEIYLNNDTAATQTLNAGDYYIITGR